MAGVSQPAELQVAPTETAPPPRWIAPWLALLAPLYVISPLALLALPQLRRLSTTAKYILAFYAVSQQLPALFSPEPLLASGLALARTLLMFGLMGVGVALGSSDRLKPFAIGLGVVFITAIVYSVLGGADVLTSRLGHPYMTSITLGLGGAFGVWIALFSSGRLLWRIPLGLGGIAVLLLSGSRGPLAAALVGCLAGFVIQRGRRVAIALLLGAGLLAGGVYIGGRLGVSAIARLGNADTTGRDIIWHNTLTVIQSQRWTGVGSYRLGKYLTSSGNSCTLFPNANGRTSSCPTWLKNLGNPWLIAHNATLQQLAESGPLGLMGLLLLLGTIILCGLNGRNPLSIAATTGLVISSINDNTLIVPSPFFAECFWIFSGICLKNTVKFQYKNQIVFLITSILISAPLYFNLFNSSSISLVKIYLLDKSNTVRSYEDYTVLTGLTVSPGQYRLILESCSIYCVEVAESRFTTVEKNAQIIHLSGSLLKQRKQIIKLKLYDLISNWNIRPVAETSWEVIFK